MKIYTKTGDAGETGLLDGTRVAKSDVRVEAYGAIDELNALLGVARANSLGADLDQMLAVIQRDLLALGARLADPAHRLDARSEKAAIGADAVGRLERWIDDLDAALPPLRRFIVAGGVPGGALLHLARTVCRRAERRVAALGPNAVEPAFLAYVNRLSDLLFVLARTVGRRAGSPEEEW